MPRPLWSKEDEPLDDVDLDELEDPEEDGDTDYDYGEARDEDRAACQR